MRFQFSLIDISFAATKTTLLTFLINSLNLKQIFVNRFDRLLSILLTMTIFLIC